MMNVISDNICSQAVKFIQNFFKIYLEDRDFQLLQSMFHHNISWFGTGEHEICRNYKDAIALMNAEEISWDGHFKIIKQWYQPIVIDENCCIVYGELKIVEDGLNTILLDMDSRFSMICLRENGEFKLYHAHFSVPNPAQTEDEFVHKTLVRDYNILLEEKLAERTKMLRDKTIELETLANNMYGGVEICLLDENFTITYLSDGFSELTGYSKAEVSKLLNNSHTALMLPEALPSLRKAIFEQIRAKKSFSVEYQIRKKDGTLIWVLDKGIVISSDYDPLKTQCILTDITVQKEQEALLAQKSFELETLTNNLQAAIIRCSFDSAFHISYANDGFFRMTGYTREQFEAEQKNELRRIIYADDVDAMYENLERQLLQSNTTVNVNRLVRRDGGFVWVLEKGTVIQQEDGTSEFHGVLIDITEQKDIEEALRISEKRYEVALGFSDLTMFEYNVLTKELMLFEKDAKMYGVTTVIPDAVETFIKRGIIAAEYADDYRAMYQKIHNGEPFAQCYINSRDVDGVLHEFQLNLTTVFDDNHKPIRTIGIRKNVTQLRQLQKEKEYGSTMAANQLMIYEVNVTRDQIISYDNQWAAESGVIGVTEFSRLKEIVTERNIVPEHRPLFFETLAAETLIKAYESDRRLLSLEYLKVTADHKQRWFRQNIHIIKDTMTGDISIRSYIADIHEQKLQELKLQDEQRLYEAMLSKTATVYEVNITKNLFLSGHEHWTELFGFRKTNNYSEMIQELGKKAIHPDDLEGFDKAFTRKNVLAAYELGKNPICYDYRRPNEQGKFVWVRCTLHLFEDTQTGDIKGHSYIEDINEAKEKEISLIYNAEHDLLTDLYNKIATEKTITNFLSTSEGKAGKHAFFIIDIDYFKLVNDNFGHAFGDAVLSQVASKLDDLFRNNIDVLGRVGGDEFIVLMKNIQNKRDVFLKAEEICEKVADIFSQSRRKHKLSASIGIAFYRDHGSTYQELYRNSDAALYVAKGNGRNQFAVYSDNMIAIESSQDEIISNELVETKTFRENTTEYVFRILYESNDKESAVNAVLGLIGKHYNVSRTYVFENSYNDEFSSNTFEWCNEGVAPQIHNLQNLSYAVLGDYQSNFKNGIFFMADVNKASTAGKEILEPQNVKSMLQFSIVKNGKFRGFIGFDECRLVSIPSKKDVSEMQNIANILGMFVMEMRASDETVAAQNIALSIIDGLNSYAYVCDPESYQILFANKKIAQLTPGIHRGKHCYEIFWNRTEPCKLCPMTVIREQGLPEYSLDMHQPNGNLRVKTTASWIKWIDNRKMCLINAINIDEYM